VDCKWRQQHLQPSRLTVAHRDQPWFYRVGTSNTKAFRIKDNNITIAVRSISVLGNWYHQLAEHHFKVLQDRFRDAKRLLWDQKQARHQFDNTCLKESIREQTDSLKYMDEEIVDGDNVHGCFSTTAIVSWSKKKARTSVGQTRERNNKTFKCDECSLWN
jgi:hypothetical protein